MENLQDAINLKKEKSSSRFITYFHILNILLILLNFALNFLGQPELKYVYLVHVIMIFSSVLFLPILTILPEIITLLFLEGQGRIIWDYQAWSRIIFDGILFLAVMKVFITNKKVYKKEVIPTAFIWLIVCHFLWYIVQIFNINAASVAGVIAATKIYIFPILLFLGLTQARLDTKSKEFTYMLGVFAFLFFLELCLNYFQIQEKQALLLKISPYYMRAMKGGVFTGDYFRPFATTFIPGGFSSFIYLTPALFFIKPVKMWHNILRFVIIGFSIINLVLSQVRSALIKYILILILIYIGDVIYHRLHYKKIIPYVIIILLAIFNFENIMSRLSSSDDKNIEKAIARTATIADTKKISTSRIDTATLGVVITNHLTKYPFGVGPGMTGAASSINQESLEHDPVLNKDTLWTHDNLFIALVIDLGYGAFFYIILILLIPVHFTQELLKLYKKKEDDKFRTVLACISSMVIIIAGNWGANAITYNPESFIFWFFAALGFYTLADQREKNKNIKSI